VDPSTVHAGSFFVEDTVGALDTTLRGASNFDGDYVASTLDVLSQQQLAWLYDDLLRPLASLLEGARRLLVAPDGVLFEIPFHALYDGASCLLERYEISYTPSAGALRLCQENHRRRGAGSGYALVVGYSRDGALPHVLQEVNAVTRVVPEATVFADQEITLAHLQEHTEQSVLLHLATHAVFRRDNPLFSALQLSSEDWLRVMDLYTLRLNGALVTLSGCETGRHRLRGGDLLGLSRGFFCAGASALVVSLWPVGDVSTAMLMERFYAHLSAGKTAASALKEAQWDLCNFEEKRNGQRARPYAHPFYWAPFCLLGAPDVRLMEEQ
jgi:CHAT domain-containing protein